MGIRERLFSTNTTDADADADADAGSESDSEQLASASTEDVEPGGSADAPDPRGEHRESEIEDAETTEGGFLISMFSSSRGTSGSQSPSPGGPTNDITADREGPPANIADLWADYYHDFSLTGEPLRIFNARVMEPGWDVSATVDGEEDEEMTEALEQWAENCAVHAGEFGQDLSVLLRQLPAQRRGKGTVLMEKAGTEEDPDSLAALVLHDPTTFKIYKRPDKNILTQPDDEVGADHPMFEDEAAAYVQYDDDLYEYDDEEPVPFRSTDIVKFVWNADTGSAWGTPLYELIDDRVDALLTKLADRDSSIRLAGHPHRIYSSEGWSQQEAKEFAQAHQSGEVSAWDDEVDKDPESLAGRTDFVSGNVDPEVVEGQVADIADAVRDDVEAIFAAMPVSRHQIAYASDINQFVVEPQQENDDREIEDERRYLERKFAPLFAEKAAELGGGSYEGEITFEITPEESENPLDRESFPAENLESFSQAWSEFARAGVDSMMPPQVFAQLMGFDLDEFAERHGFTPEELTREALDESAEEVQAQMDAADDAPLPGSAPGDASEDEDDSEGGGGG